MRFYLIAGLINGGILMGSLLWLWIDGLFILPIITLILSSFSTGLLISEADE